MSNEAKAETPLLSVITVVRDDVAGLAVTCGSLAILPAGTVEHVVIDGSAGDVVRLFLTQHPAIKWIGEPDEGIYDAMNKGLALASGDYSLFLNAGDRLHPNFSFPRLRDLIAPISPEAAPVIIGYSVEAYDGWFFLRPGLGREEKAFGSPPHQATFYPRRFYAANRYRVDLRINGDGEFTARALQRCGAIFLPTVVCEFSLGGVSSSYSSGAIASRLKEVRSPLQIAKLFSKALLWRVLPRERFYKILASYKYTPVTEIDILALRPSELYFDGPDRLALTYKKPGTGSLPPKAD